MTKTLTTHQIKLYEILLEHGPLDQQQIQNQTILSPDDIAAALNGLLDSSRIVIEKNDFGEIRFSAVPKSELANAET